MSSPESLRREDILGPLEVALRVHRHSRERPPKPIKEQWRENRFAEVPNVITSERAEKASEFLREFCALPDELKNGVCIPGANGRGAASYGYVERRPDLDPTEIALGKIPEHKEYFHYAPFIERDLREEIRLAGPKAKTLIENMRDLWVIVEQRAHETLKRLEEENAHNPAYRDFTLRFFPDGITGGDLEKHQPKLKLRLMSYKKIEGKNVLSANNHYDAGALTFALWENAPGLQVGAKQITDQEGRVICSENMQEVERPDGTALFWPSLTFSKIDSEVEPTWHGVKQHSRQQTVIGEENRAVLVAFLNMDNHAIPSLNQTHGVTAPKPNGQ